MLRLRSLEALERQEDERRRKSSREDHLSKGLQKAVRDTQTQINRSLKQGKVLRVKLNQNT